MKTIAKNKMSALLDSLIKKYQVFAPVQKDDLVVDFNAIQSGDEAYLEYNNSNEPVKKLFFPQSETLFTYTKGGSTEAPDLKPKRSRVIFGVRPCDTKSLSLMDKVF
ncbi:MAG: 4Fe-4S ferredoxin, partial [Planctomycetes bacterium]|nr:4Fe-4S ferredoxin [Planctomycetota bacterium]